MMIMMMTMVTRRALTPSLILLGVYLLAAQVKPAAAAGAVDMDLDHLADLSAEIDRKSSIASWIQNRQVLPPAPASLPLHHHAPTNSSFSSSLFPRWHPLDNADPSHPREPSNKDTPASSSSSPALQKQKVLPDVSAPTQRGDAVVVDHDATHPLPPPPPQPPSRAGRIPPGSQNPSQTAPDEEGGRSPPPQQRAIQTSGYGAGEDQHQQTAALEVTGRRPLAFKQNRRPQMSPSKDLSEMPHVSGKRLRMMEQDLANRKLTLPEHRLYHQDLLLRRLKMLHHAPKPQGMLTGSGSGAKAGTGNGEEENAVDGWEEELSIRRQLADRAVQYGLEKKKTRTAHPDPDREPSIMERIHRDAEEILRRRAQEKEYVKTMTQKQHRGGGGGGEKAERGDTKSVGQTGTSSLTEVTSQNDQRSPSADAAEREDRDGGRAGSALEKRPVVSQHPVSARQRRKMKQRSRALVRALRKQKRVLM